MLDKTNRKKTAALALVFIFFLLVQHQGICKGLADEVEDTLVVHKLKSDSSDSYKGETIYPSKKEAEEAGSGYYVEQSTGELKDYEGNVVNDAEYLEGIEFTLVDITHYYLYIYYFIKNQPSGEYSFTLNGPVTSDKATVKEAAYEIATKCYQKKLGIVFEEKVVGDFEGGLTVPGSPMVSPNVQIASTDEFGRVTFHTKRKTVVNFLSGFAQSVGLNPGIHTMDSVYLLVESSVLDNKGVYSMALPMVITYPLHSTEDAETIHLYPKNKVEHMEKEWIYADTSGVSIGDSTVYQLRIPLPDNFAASRTYWEYQVFRYDTLTIKDTPAPGLKVKRFVTDNGETVKEGDVYHGFKIQNIIYYPNGAAEIFAKPDGESTLGKPGGAGSEEHFIWTQEQEDARNESDMIALFVELEVTKDIPIYNYPIGADQSGNINTANFELYNAADGVVSGVPIKDEASAEQPLTYGYQFLKVDNDWYETGLGEDEFGRLSGAKFQVKLKNSLSHAQDPGSLLPVNEPLKFVKENDVYRPATQDEIAQGQCVDVLEVDNGDGEKGLLSLYGLEQGDYELIEVVAPEGYLLPSTTIDFHVGENTYNISDQPGEGAWLNDNNWHDIPNVKRGLLPSTGGTGILIILIVGSGLLGLTLLLRKMQKKVNVDGQEI
jgi:hypothetical protein